MEIYKDTRTAIKCARLGLKMHGAKVWTSKNDLQMFRNFDFEIEKLQNIRDLFEKQITINNRGVKNIWKYIKIQEQQ